MKKTKTILMIIMLLGIIAGACLGTLTSKVIFTIQAQYSGGTGLGTALETVNLDYSISLASGAGANQANLIYTASGTLLDDANDVLNFYSSVDLTDTFGNALTMEKLKLLVIYNTSTEANLEIGGGTVAMALFENVSDILVLPPGGKFLYSAPNVNGLNIKTNTDLNLTHGGQGEATLTYKLIAIGVD